MTLRALSATLLLLAVPAAAAPPGKSPVPARRIHFNGRSLSKAQLRTIERLEAKSGHRVADGAYFYDPVTGAAGLWGGPALAFLPAGLDLNGRAPPNASGGGSGTLTGVFVNGRELHPVDVRNLEALVGAVYPGRWWVDAQGNYGMEGGPPAGNLFAIARSRGAGQRGGTAWSRRYEGVGGPSGNMNLASDGETTCVTTAGSTYCTGQ